MSQRWFVRHNGTVIGPINSSMLKQLAGTGQITPGHSVRVGEKGAWFKAAQVKDLFPKDETGKAIPHSSPTAPKPSSPALVIALPVAEVPSPPRWKWRIAGATAAILVVGGAGWYLAKLSMGEPAPIVAAVDPPPKPAPAEERDPQLNEELSALRRSLEDLKKQNETLTARLDEKPPAPPAISASPTAAVAVAAPPPDPKANQLNQPVNPAPPAPTTAAGVIAEVEAAIGLVECEDKRGKVGVGTGFLFERDDLFVTNFHVVEETAKLTIHFNDAARTKRTVSHFVLALPQYDLAVLKLAQPVPGVKPMRRSKQPLRKGDAVLAIGCPRGLDFAVTEGIISAVRLGSELSNTPAEIGEAYLALGYADDARWIQTSAAITHGNSGGPLIAADGSVVGINTWSVARGLNPPSFALAIERVPEQYPADIAATPIAGLPAPLPPPAAVAAAPADDDDERELKRRVAERSALLKKIYDQRTVLIGQKQAVDTRLSELGESISVAEGEYESLANQAAAVNNLIIQLQQDIAQHINAIPMLNEAELIIQRQAISDRQLQLQREQTNYRRLEGQAAGVRTRLNGLYSQRQQQQNVLAGLFSQADQLRLEWLAVVDPFDKLCRREHEAALTVLNEWVTLDADNASAYFCRALAQYGLGDRSAALTDVTRAVDLDDGVRASSLAFRARLLAENGDVTAATADFGEAWKLDKTESLIYLYRGQMYAREKRHELAAKEYSQAVALAPSSAECRRQLAEFLMLRETTRSTNARRALQEATKACELTKKAEWTCLVTLAKIQAFQGDFNLAIDTVNKAKRLCLFEDCDRCIRLAKSFAAKETPQFELE